MNTENCGFDFVCVFLNYYYEKRKSNLAVFCCCQPLSPPPQQVFTHVGTIWAKVVTQKVAPLPRLSVFFIFTVLDDQFTFGARLSVCFVCSDDNMLWGSKTLGRG